MSHRLYIVEGLPCSGKSTISALTASMLSSYGKVVFVDEGTCDHPADYEFHALAPAGLLSDDSMIVPLSEYSGELFDRLLPYKIYDMLPWEIEKPLMLEKWRSFVKQAKEKTQYVFNCVLLQNPMCETMMRFGLQEEESEAYIRQIADIIQPLDPVVIYLQNDEIAVSIQKASAERSGWLEAVINYHVNGAFGKRISAEGFDGYIQCLEERQARELRILSRLPLKSIVLRNPQHDWNAAKAQLQKNLKTI